MPTKAELLVAAAFRGFAEALVAAGDEKPPKKEPKPQVIPVDAVRAAVQETLPGIVRAMLAEDQPPEPNFGIGDIEDDPEERARRQGGDPVRYDPNLPGSGGWQPAPE